MPAYEFVPATFAHAAALAETMSDACRAEAWAATRETPYQALTGCIAASREAKAGLADGEVLLIYGLIPPALICDTAMIWMLTSRALPRHARWFMVESRRVIDEWLTEHKKLANYSDLRHTRANRWLRWLGFSFDEPQPLGPDGVLFARFEKGGA